MIVPKMALCPICGRKNTIEGISDINSPDPWGVCKCICGYIYFVNIWSQKNQCGVD